MEYIKANSIEYECQKVTTGINNISFIMEGQEIGAVHAAFKDITELTVSGEDKETYGIYENLYFTSATVNADGAVCVTMSAKPDTEIRLENLEATQDVHGEAISELAEIIAGGE